MQSRITTLTHRDNCAKRLRKSLSAGPKQGKIKAQLRHTAIKSGIKLGQRYGIASWQAKLKGSGSVFTCRRRRYARLIGGRFDRPAIADGGSWHP
jgi:hypothetical protein